MTGDPLGSLARCVGDPDCFVADRFGRRPHVWRGAGFEDLLSLADVDAQLVGGGLRRPAVRLVRDGDVLDPATWTRRARTGTTRIDDLVHAGRVLDLFAGGATVVLQSLQRWWPPITSFCRELERALGHPMQANAYLTPPGAAGLTPHHDTHDVLVLQVHGTKHWVVREPLFDAPLARHRTRPTQAAQQPVLFEAALGAGDCLYLPRGFVHSAMAQRGVSLHLTLGVLVTTVHDVLRRLVERAGEERSFREALPARYLDDVGVTRSVVKEIVADFVRWLESVDAGEVAGDLAARSGVGRQPALDGHLLELAGLDAIGDGTLVRRRDGAVIEIATGATVRLVLPDRVVELPAAVDEPVRRLLDGGAHRVCDLGDALDTSSRLVLVRRLVREGALRTADGS